MNDKNIKIVLMTGIIIVSFSVFYYLVVRPIHNSNQLGKCLERAANERSYGFKYYQDIKDSCFKQY